MPPSIVISAEVVQMHYYTLPASVLDNYTSLIAVCKYK